MYYSCARMLTGCLVVSIPCNFNLIVSQTQNFCEANGHDGLFEYCHPSSQEFVFIVSGLRSINLGLFCLSKWTILIKKSYIRTYSKSNAFRGPVLYASPSPDWVGLFLFFKAVLIGNELSWLPVIILKRCRYESSLQFKIKLRGLEVQSTDNRVECCWVWIPGKELNQNKLGLLLHFELSKLHWFETATCNQSRLGSQIDSAACLTNEADLQRFNFSDGTWKPRTSPVLDREVVFITRCAVIGLGCTLRRSESALNIDLICSKSWLRTYLARSDWSDVRSEDEHRSSARVAPELVCNIFETPMPAPSSKLRTMSYCKKQTPKLNRKGCGRVRRQRIARAHSSSPMALMTSIPITS